MRGRTRFIEALPNIDESILAVQPPQSFTGNKITDQSYYDERGNDYAKLSNSLGEKRAPKGFLGMRGKKRDGEYNDDDFEVIGDVYEKRIPIGFTGVRGKKDFSILQ